MKSHGSLEATLWLEVIFELKKAHHKNIYIKFMKPLKQSFFMKNTAQVAEELLGSYLVRKTKKDVLVGRIVETEAYLGLNDPCCHSFSGSCVGRAKTMYLSGGHSYVYFIYGMYYCFNVVTGSEKEPEAVLIRALEPVEGFSEMKKNRIRNNMLKMISVTGLCSGPGKLCQALDITKSLNAKNLSQKGAIYIASGERFRQIEVDRRIGLPPHEDAAYWPLRFYIKNNPFVSVQASANA